MEAITCHITQEPLSKEQAYRGDTIRKQILSLIQEDYPDFNDDAYMSAQSLNVYRRKYLSSLIADENSDLDALEKEVLEAVATHDILTDNVELEIESTLTIGQKLADKIAEFGGSWFFISFFFLFILMWVFVNINNHLFTGFDPYPFILLNLILSCLAAIQAPIIIMSQNRVEDNDRRRSEHDYQINLKAELEIKLLNEKIDHLISRQNVKMLEIQEVQTDFLQDILMRVERKK